MDLVIQDQIEIYIRKNILEKTNFLIFTILVKMTSQQELNNDLIFLT
jgi:hypothetical protein